MKRPRLSIVSVPITVVTLIGGCDRASPTPAPTTRTTPPHVTFVDVTDTAGIDLITTSGTLPTHEILEVNGGGVALFDYDNDGDPDLFVANGATLASPDAGPGSRLFRNDSTAGEIRFTDVTQAAGIDLRRWAMGVAAGDADGDGWIDLHVTCFGPNVLLHNLGDGRFEDVTSVAGIAGDAWSTSSAFGDIDGDQDLDLFVVNYLHFDPAAPPPAASYKGQRVMAGPHGLKPTADRLWLNQGNGTFIDATTTDIIPEIVPAFGLNVIMLDLDGDGRQDILVGNDSMANDCYVHGEPTGAETRLHNIGRASGLAANADGAEQATMGIAVADVDGDQRPDIFTTNFSADTNTLHRGTSSGHWQDSTRQYGLGLRSRPWLGWTTAFIDLDHDLDEDLVILNGHVYPGATLDTMDATYAQSPQILIRNADRFEAVKAASHDTWLGRPRRDRAAAFGDLDGDGDLDLVTAELNGPVRVIENRTPHPTNITSMIVRLLDDRVEARNPQGLGSRIRSLEPPEPRARRSSVRWIHSGGPFQSSSDSVMHLSIPRIPSPDRSHQRQPDIWVAQVTWPDGTQTTHRVEPQAAVTLRYSEHE